MCLGTESTDRPATNKAEGRGRIGTKRQRPVNFCVLQKRSSTDHIEQSVLPLVFRGAAPARFTAVVIRESQLRISGILGVAFDPAAEAFGDGSGCVRAGKRIEIQVARFGQEFNEKPRQLSQYRRVSEACRTVYISEFRSARIRRANRACNDKRCAATGRQARIHSAQPRHSQRIRVPKK